MTGERVCHAVCFCIDPEVCCTAWRVHRCVMDFTWSAASQLPGCKALVARCRNETVWRLRSMGVTHRVSLSLPSASLRRYSTQLFSKTSSSSSRTRRFGTTMASQIWASAPASCHKTEDVRAHIRNSCSGKVQKSPAFGPRSMQPSRHR